MFTRASICALLLALILLPACGSKTTTTPAATSAPATTSTASSTAAAAVATPTTIATPTAVADLSWEDVVTLLTPSVVMIRGDFPATAVSSAGAGSGTGIVMSNDGLILTNAHVVDGAAAITVAASGSNKERPARVVGISSCDDLAVIKVDDTTGLKPATFGKSSEQKVGEDVAVLGYPLGSSIGTDLSITRGIISKLDLALDPYQSLIQTDAAINHGNSGGPMVNRKGQVIGINTLSVAGTSLGTNIGFAISSDLAQQVIPDLKSGHNRLYLGMNLGPNDYADYFGTSAGLVVEAVATNGPASAAGVRPAFLLTQLEGLDVNSDADVCKILRSHQDGDGLKAQFINVTDTESELLEGEVTIGQPVSSSKVTIIDRQAFEQPTPTPGSTGNEQDFSWDFTKDDGDWYTGSSSAVSASIANGQYNITVGAGSDYFFNPGSVPDSSDLSVQTDVSQKDAFVGVAVRYTQDADGNLSYYDCFLVGDNTYGCGVEVKGQFNYLVQSETSSAIKVGQTNTLTLTVVGNTITFNINGTDVKTLTDSSLTQGSIALEVGASQEGAGGSATFSNTSAAVRP